MRLVALGLCAAFASALVASPVYAASGNRADTVAGTANSTPAAINDHAGAFIPSTASDRAFEYNPDGNDDELGGNGDADLDEDGNDEAMYQGEDDVLPS